MKSIATIKKGMEQSMTMVRELSAMLDDQLDVQRHKPGSGPTLEITLQSGLNGRGTEITEVEYGASQDGVQYLANFWQALIAIRTIELSRLHFDDYFNIEVDQKGQRIRICQTTAVPDDEIFALTEAQATRACDYTLELLQMLAS